MGLGDNNFDYLLKANTPAITGPLDMAGKGATLAQLLQNVQKGGLELDTMRQLQQLYSNPDYMSGLQSIMSGGSGGAGGSTDSAPFFRAISQTPLAAQNAISNVIGLQKNVGDIAKTQADTAKARGETLDTSLKWLGNFAANLKQNPTPAGFQGFMQLYGMTKLPPDALGTPPTSMAELGPYLDGVASIGLDQEKRANVTKTYATLPGEVAKTQAETEQAQAGTAKTKQETNLALSGSVIQDGNGNSWQMTIQPGVNGQPPRVVPVPVKTGGNSPTPNATFNFDDKATMGDVRAALTDATRPPQQFKQGLGAGEKTLLEASAKNAADLESRIPAANQALRTLDNMQQVAGNGGIFAGPIKGSDFFKQIAGVISQLPGASDDLRAKVSNTQVWDQQGGEFLLNTLGEMKGTVPRSQAAMQAIRNIKPNTLMTPQAQQQVIDYLRQTFDAQIQWAGAAAKGIREGKTLSEVEPPVGKQPGAVRVNPDGSYTMTVQ